MYEKVLPFWIPAAWVMAAPFQVAAVMLPMPPSPPMVAIRIPLLPAVNGISDAARKGDWVASHVVTPGPGFTWAPLPKPTALESATTVAAPHAVPHSNAHAARTARLESCNLLADETRDEGLLRVKL